MIRVSSSSSLPDGVMAVTWASKRLLIPFSRRSIARIAHESCYWNRRMSILARYLRSCVRQQDVTLYICLKTFGNPGRTELFVRPNPPGPGGRERKHMAAKKGNGAEAVLKRVQTEKIRWIDLHFVDVVGGLQHITIPSTSVGPDEFKRGIGKLDGSSIRGFKEIHESDMVMRPDPSTFAILPWYEGVHKTA